MHVKKKIQSIFYSDSDQIKIVNLPAKNTLSTQRNKYRERTKCLFIVWDDMIHSMKR